MLKDVMGACLYCGQMHMVKMEPDAMDEEINYTATLNCDCDEALILQVEYQNINTATEHIKELYQDSDVQGIMIEAVGMIGHGTISQIKIKKEKTTYTMTRNSDKTIRVEKETKIKEKREN